MRSTSSEGGVVGITRFSGWLIPPHVVLGFVEVVLVLIFLGQNSIYPHLIPILDQLLHLHVLGCSPSKFV